jgi:hypothetical protein
VSNKFLRNIFYGIFNLKTTYFKILKSIENECFYKHILKNLHQNMFIENECFCAEALVSRKREV